MIPLYAYPQPGKDKSRRLLSAFAEGAGGELREPWHGISFIQDRSCASAFYGTVGIESLFAAAREMNDWYYLDNAYFDRARERFFRISRNALQRAALAPDFKRLKQLVIEISPWRRAGAHVLVVEQSEYFMREIARRPLEQWRGEVLETLRRHTDRPIRIRAWQRDKSKASSSLVQDLAGAWAVVTHASAAANEAVLAGIPVFLTGQSVALPMGLSQLEQIESPRRPDGRREWAAQLAASQWTEEEMRSGVAWESLTKGEA